MTKVTFLGTGPYLAVERYWNGFVLDDRIVVEPSPTVLPHLHRCGIDPAGLDVVVISHFHADHTFGWPFLLLELLRCHVGRPVWVVGPTGVERYLATLMEVAGVPGVQQTAHDVLDVHYVEVDGTDQVAGPLAFRAVAMDHVEHLDAYGYLFSRNGSVLGYSGDTGPGPALDSLAAASDALVVECNGPHHPSNKHLDVDDLVDLRRRFPQLRLVLTHVGAGLALDRIEGATTPDDLQTLQL